MKITNNNPWDILEISTTATQEEIKHAFKKKAMIHHPDRGGDKEQFRKIAEAYEKLRKNTVVPIIETPSTRLVNVGLTVKQQIEGINDFIETDTGEIIEVSIPPGAMSNDKFKIKNGHENVIINVKELVHKDLTRQGYSLIMNKTIDIIDAMVGNTIIVKGPCDEDIEVTIPPGVNCAANCGRCGTTIVVPDKGLFNKQKNERGGLHIIINVKIPSLDTQESINEFIKRLKNEH